MLGDIIEEHPDQVTKPPPVAIAIQNATEPSIILKSTVAGKIHSTSKKLAFYLVWIIEIPFLDISALNETGNTTLVSTLDKVKHENATLAKNRTHLRSKNFIFLTKL